MPHFVFSFSGWWTIIWFVGFALQVSPFPYKVSQRLYHVSESHAPSVLFDGFILSHSFIRDCWDLSVPLETPESASCHPTSSRESAVLEEAIVT